MNQAIDEEKGSLVTFEEKFLYMFYFSFVMQYVVHFSISLLIYLFIFPPHSYRASFPYISSFLESFGAQAHLD